MKGFNQVFQSGESAGFGLGDSLMGESDQTPEGLLKRGLELHNRLLKSQTIETFEEMIEMYPGFSKGRIIFSTVLVKYGKFDRACVIVECGILQFNDQLPESERKSQYDLCVHIGELYLKAYKNWKQHKKFFSGLGDRDMIEFAFKWTQEALCYSPKKVKACENMAEILMKLGKTQDAQKYYEMLKDKGSKYIHAFCDTLDPEVDYKEMESCYRRIIRDDPNDSRAYEELAMLLEDEDEENDYDRDQYLRKAKYYTWLPSFCKEAKFNPANFQYFYDIVQRENPKGLFDIITGQNFKNLHNSQTAVAQLIHNNNKSTTDLLISYVYNHVNPCDLRVIFRELWKRSEREEVQHILYELACDNKSKSIVVKTTLKILAKRKYQRLYERLIMLLPGDMKILDLGVVEALGFLGDPRSVDQLIKGMSIGFGKKHQMSKVSGVGSRGHLRFRRRCCLALGCFPKERRAYQALRQALDVKVLRVCASVALFNISKKGKYLNELKTCIKSYRSMPGVDVYNFFREHHYSSTRGRDIMKDILNDYNHQRVVQGFLCTIL